MFLACVIALSIFVIFCLVGCGMGVFITKYLNRKKMDISAAHNDSGELKLMTLTQRLPATSLKGHCHGILASFYNAKICSCINGNPKIMMQFCYLGLYHYTETIYCRLALSMARMEMD